MNKLYAIFASILMVSATAMAETPEDIGSVRTGRVVVQQDRFLEGLHAATTFAGGGAFHSGDCAVDQEKFEKKKSVLGAVDEESEQNDSTPVFATPDAQELHADMVWALTNGAKFMYGPACFNAEVGMSYSFAGALQQALEGKFEDSVGSLVKVGTAAALVYVVERFLAADVAKGVTSTAGYVINPEGIQNENLRAIANSFVVNLGKVVEENLRKTGKTFMSWVMGTDVVDDSTVLGRVYLKVSGIARKTTSSATRFAKGLARKAAAAVGSRHAAVKRSVIKFFGFGGTVTAEVTA